MSRTTQQVVDELVGAKEAGKLHHTMSLGVLRSSEWLDKIADDAMVRGIFVVTIWIDQWGNAVAMFRLVTP